MKQGKTEIVLKLRKHPDSFMLSQETMRVYIAVTYQRGGTERPNINVEFGNSIYQRKDMHDHMKWYVQREIFKELEEKLTRGLGESDLGCISVPSEGEYDGNSQVWYPLQFNDILTPQRLRQLEEIVTGIYRDFLENYEDIIAEKKRTYPAFVESLEPEPRQRIREKYGG